MLFVKAEARRSGDRLPAEVSVGSAEHLASDYLVVSWLSAKLGTEVAPGVLSLNRHIPEVGDHPSPDGEEQQRVESDVRDQPPTSQPHRPAEPVGKPWESSAGNELNSRLVGEVLPLRRSTPHLEIDRTRIAERKRATDVSSSLVVVAGILPGDARRVHDPRPD